MGGIEMKLAIEWSAPIRSIAIECGSTIWEAAYEVRETVSLPGAIHGLVRREGLDLSKLEEIVINRGPGSYTGIRLAVATVQGIALASSHPGLTIRVVNTFQLLSQIVADHWIESGDEEYLLVVYAQRQEFFCVSWSREAKDVLVRTPRIMSLEDIVGISRDAQIRVIGTDIAGRMSEGIAEEIHPEAGQLLKAGGDRISVKELANLEPYYTRPQEFTKAAAPRFGLI